MSLVKVEKKNLQEVLKEAIHPIGPGSHRGVVMSSEGVVELYDPLPDPPGDLGDDRVP
jgi:hypothetical protein